MTRVLVVHRNPRHRQELAAKIRSLSSVDVTPLPASTPEQALVAARTQSPSVVLFELDHGSSPSQFEVTSALADMGCAIIGLLDPATQQACSSDFAANAMRSGVRDLISMPASTHRLESALNLLNRHTGSPSRPSARIVAMVAHKGGVGTSTLAAAMSRALARRDAGAGVVLVEARCRFGQSVELLGASLGADVSEAAALCSDDSTGGVRFGKDVKSELAVVGAPVDSFAMARISSSDMASLLVALGTRFGTVFVDLPNRLDDAAFAALDLADHIVVVTEGLSRTLSQSRQFLGFLESLGYGDRLRLVVNGVPTPGELPAELRRVLGRTPDHLAPFDAGLLRAGESGSATVDAIGPDLAGVIETIVASWEPRWLREAA